MDSTTNCSSFATNAKNRSIQKEWERFFGTSKMGRKVFKNAKELLCEQNHNESPTKVTENGRDKSF
jgi:hypothetical protein